MSLIEVLIAMTVLGTVAMGVVEATKSSSGAFRQSASNNSLDTRTGRGLNRIIAELSGAGMLQPPNMTSPANSNWIEFQQNTGWESGSIQWGPVIRLSWEMAAGETNNGLDDNNDGQIDEGNLVRTESPGPGAVGVTLVRGIPEMASGETANGEDDNGNGLIDEAGLSFYLDGNTLIISLCVAHLGPNGTLQTRQIETAYTVRN